MWTPVKRWWLRRAGAHCILIETDSSSRFLRGELLIAGLARFIVIATVPLPPLPREIVRRWEIWAVPAERPASPPAATSPATCPVLARPRLAWSLIGAAISRACD